MYIYAAESGAHALADRPAVHGRSDPARWLGRFRSGSGGQAFLSQERSQATAGRCVSGLSGVLSRLHASEGQVPQSGPRY